MEFELSIAENIRVTLDKQEIADLKDMQPGFDPVIDFTFHGTDILSQEYWDVEVRIGLMAGTKYYFYDLVTMKKCRDEQKGHNLKKMLPEIIHTDLWKLAKEDLLAELIMH